MAKQKNIEQGLGINTRNRYFFIKLKMSEALKNKQFEENSKALGQNQGDLKHQQQLKGQNIQNQNLQNKDLENKRLGENCQSGTCDKTKQQ